MVLLLNEKSLDGQFASLEEFYKTLPEMSKNLKILQELNIRLYKHSSLYSRKITSSMSLFDLQNIKGNVNPLYRDQIRKWKSELASLTNVPPFWNEEEQESEDSIQEAARRNTDILSFKHPDYDDVMLTIALHEKEIMLHSIVSTKYLLDVLKKQKAIDTLSYLRNRYTGKRLVLERLDTETQSVKFLQKDELDELMMGLERFETAESWTSICGDSFFNYKAYQPPLKKKSYFFNTSFEDKKIDKFRCGQHSQIRCFGYREGEQFYVIMIERDHSVSDTG